MKPEIMHDFFEARIDTYDSHMLNEVAGCREGYRRMAEEVPEGCRYLLDLGAGTGLDLIPIFERHPDLCVSAIDLSGEMLARLKRRFPKKHITAIVGDFTRMQLGIPFYGAAVSFEAMHHLTAEERLPLYTAIHGALLGGGVYLEGDYVVDTKEEAAAMRAAAEEAVREYPLPEGERYHLDIPMTEEEVKALLLEAGFSAVEVIYREGATALFRARK